MTGHPEKPDFAAITVNDELIQSTCHHHHVHKWVPKESHHIVF